MAGGCVALPFPVYQPAMRLIASITNSNPMVVTTTFAHQYVTGTIVRLDIPTADGMYQANQQFAPITVISPTTFTMPIDSTYYDTFAIPASPPSAYTCAQVIAIGENNDILTAAVQNVLPYGAT